MDDTAINEILTSDRMKYMPDVLIVYADLFIPTINLMLNELGVDVRYKLITRWYDNPTPIILDYWYSGNQSFLFDNNLFPNKCQNFNGMIFNVSIFTYKPYSIIDESVIVRPHEIANSTLHGFEVLILREFANKYNMTLNFTIDPNNWGDVFDNRTGYGLFGNIAESRSDIAIGGVAVWLAQDWYMEESFPYTTQGITCLVPIPRLKDKFNLLILPFTGSLWAAVLISTVFLTLSFNYISRTTRFIYEETPVVINRESLKRNPVTVIDDIKIIIKRIFDGFYESFYIIYGLTFLQPLPESAEYSNNAFRNLLTWILLQTLLISTAYSSGLSAIMTLPQYEKPIKTMDDLIDSDLEWGANDEAWVLSISGSKGARMKRFLSKFRIYDDDKLERIATNNERTFAYTIENLPSGTFAIGDYINEENVKGLQRMVENIYWAQGCACFRKSSPLVPYFNKLVFEIKDSGLMLNYETQVALNYLNIAILNHVKYAGRGAQENDNAVILRLYDLQGVFLLWIVGVLLACLCFGIEKYFKYKNRKTICCM